MGHAEVAQTPAQTAEDILPAGAEQAAAEVALGDSAGRGVGVLVHGGQRGGIQQLAVAKVDHDGHQHQRQHHQHALEEIRPAHSGEAAEEGVRHDDQQEHEHGQLGGHVREQGGEHGGAGHQSGGHINGVGKQEDQRAHQLQGAGVHREAVGQVLGHGDGIVSSLGEGAQTLSAQDPVGGGAQRQTDADPHLAEAEGQNGAGKTHQQPRGHVGGLSGQRRDPGAHGASAEEEVLGVLVGAVKVEDQRYSQQDDEVGQKYDDFPIHDFSVLCVSSVCLLLKHTKV